MTEADSTIELREARLSAMLRVLPQAVFELDRNGHFVDAHGGDVELLATKDAIVGRPFTEVLSAFPALVATMSDLLEKAFAGALAMGEYMLEQADGEHVFEARAVAATPNHAVVAVTDVTESRRLFARLVIADRQRATYALAGSLLHEVATPAAYLLASLDTLVARVPPEGEVGELATIARDGARQLAEVCRDFRALARVDETALDADVTSTLEHVLRFSSAGRAGSVIRVDAELVPRASIPEARLAQVFMNLLANASHAVRQVREPRVTLAILRSAEGVRIDVSDNGEGIAPDELRRIFEPFFTTKADSEGTGLGLWIVNRILKAHGGTIECESTAGEGTTFRVLLPVAPASLD